MRHQGVMESQALHAMGLRPRWDDAGRVTGLDLVPAYELKRPRLDVLLSVTGSYRDQFPSVMRWLDEGVQQVVALRGQDNFVARNSEAIAKTMQAGGATAAQARRWSTARVFSNEQGAYGTGLADAAQATDLWKTAGKAGGDAEMTSLYMARMGHAYGEGLGAPVGGAGQAQALEKLRSGAYASNLRQVDTALLSRTSNTYGMLTSDDPFQYLGGISQAVRQLTGKDPAMYVQNLRDNTEVKTESAASALTKEMQTRYLHPQWINAQKAEGYSGTLQVLKTAQFLWGWQVTAPQTVRQDHWQSLHNVYVRDQYKLGTREWLEGDNRAAFAQTLERMLDAVRLNYWQPDAATKKELVQVYQEALKATGLRESNPAVQRFAAAQSAALAQPAGEPRATPPAAATQVVPPTVDAPVDPAAPVPVQGLKLEPQKERPAPASPAADVVFSLAALLVTGLLLVLGGWRQSRRGLSGNLPRTRVRSQAA
jgi:cobaltochelatase CobN